MRSATVLVPITLSAVVALSLAITWRQGTSENTPVPPGPGLALGTAIRAGNLAVWPLLAGEVPDIGPFRTLKEAQTHGELRISECKEAAVAALQIENRGDIPILACAGAIFAGGKQDRQLGEDIVVGAHTTVPVRTFCVEQNRWHGGDTFVVSGKATRAVRAAGQYDGDQSGVWRGVADSRATMGLGSGSYRAVANARQKRATKVLTHLRAQEGHLVGYAYAIHGKVMGMRTFAHPSLLEPRLDAMVHAVCVESEQAGTAPESQLASVSEEEQRMMLTMRMASEAYDDGEYAAAVAQVERVLALDPENAQAKELLRIANESRHVGDRGKVRNRYRDEWRTVMEQLEATGMATRGALRYPVRLGEVGIDVRGLGGTNGGPLAVLDDVTGGLDDNASAALDNSGPGLGTATNPRSGIFFNAGGDGEYRSRVANVFDSILGFEQAAAIGDNALVPSAYEPAAKTVETNGVNRNRYRKTLTGNHATCSIRGKDGRWIPLVRDWTAR